MGASDFMCAIGDGFPVVSVIFASELLICQIGGNIEEL
jgi:hypothetical protein